MIFFVLKISTILLLAIHLLDLPVNLQLYSLLSITIYLPVKAQVLIFVCLPFVFFIYIFLIDLIRIFILRFIALKFVTLNINAMYNKRNGCYFLVRCTFSNFLNSLNFFNLYAYIYSFIFMSVLYLTFYFYDYCSNWIYYIGSLYHYHCICMQNIFDYRLSQC